LKRQLQASKQTKIKAPRPLKSVESNFAKILKQMIDQIHTRFVNQAIDGLNKNTVDKFQDGQIGNFGVIFLKIANKVKRKLLRQYSDDRIDNLVETMTTQVDSRNQDLLYKLIEDEIGIPAKELISSEGLTPNINALILETQQWVKKLRDDTIGYFTNTILRGMAEGKTLPEIQKNLNVETKKRKNNANMVSRTQVNTFNSLSTKIRAQNLGITKAIWVTSRDERVRESHKARDGKEFDLDKGLYSSIDGKTLLPSLEINCRCGYILIIPEESV